MQQTGDISCLDAGFRFAETPFRTHYILKELREVGPAGRKVDFLYVSMKIYVYSVTLTSH